MLISGPLTTTCSIGSLTRENYAYKYDLSKVPTARTSLEWPPDSRKLHSKVSNDQCTCSGHTCELAPLTRENYAHKYDLTSACELLKGFSKIRSLHQ